MRTVMNKKQTSKPAASKASQPCVQNPLALIPKQPQGALFHKKCSEKQTALKLLQQHLRLLGRPHEQSHKICCRKRLRKQKERQIMSFITGISLVPQGNQ